MPEVHLTSLAALDAFAAKFVADHAEGAIVTLSGDLGAGKTTLVRAVVRCLGKGTERVTSPTFVLHQSYASLSRPVEHFDLYRLENVTLATLLEIGYFEAWDRARSGMGFLFVEWPEMVKEPESLRASLNISLKIVGETRVLSVIPTSE